MEEVNKDPIIGLALFLSEIKDIYNNNNKEEEDIHILVVLIDEFDSPFTDHYDNKLI